MTRDDSTTSATGEALFRVLADAAPAVLWLTDPEGRCVFLSRGWHELTGQGEAEALGFGWIEAVHPDDRAAARDIFLAANARREPFALDYRVRRADGCYRWAIDAGRPRFSPEGAFLGYVGSVVDIHERKLAEEELRRKEARLELALQGTSDGLWDWDIARGEVYHSPRFAEMLGYAPEGWESSYANWLRHTHPDDVPQAEERVRRYLAGELSEYVSVFRMRRKDGTWRWIMSRAKALRDEAGRPVRMVGAHTDVTDQRETEAALREANAQLLASERAARRRSEQLQALARAALEVGAAPTLDATLRVVTEAARRVVGAHASVVSLTRGPDWSQAINAVSLSDKYARWRGYEALPDGSGIYAWVCQENRPARLTQAELEAHPRWRGFGRHAGEHPPLRGWLAVPLVGRDGRNLGLIQLSDKEDGGEFDEADEAILVQLAQLASAAIERAETEQALRESQRRLNAVLDNASVAVFLMDHRQHCVYMNAAAERLTGYTLAETQGRALHDVVHHTRPDGRPYPLEECPIDRAFPERMRVQGEEVFVHKDGSFYPVAFTASPIRDDDAQTVGTIIEVRDIRVEKAAREALARSREELERLVEQRTAELLREVEERRRAEEALRQGEQLQAIGRLTGGIAHDFNNLLQVVASGVSLLRSASLGEDKRALVLDGMAQAAQNAKELVDRLLSFARRRTLKPEAFDLNERLRGLSEILGRTLGSKIKIVTDFAPDLWPVLADPGQLEVALLNLAVNARDAMPDGGRLVIATRNESLPATPERAAGDYVRVAVSDTGTGMPPAVRARLFEPFFTTKGAGQGSGLGLAQVHGFAKQSGGDVAVESEVGQGTTVILHLPRARDADAAARPDEPDPPAVPDPGTGWATGRTVLVVDDNAAVASFACRLLEEMGFATEQVASADEALRRLEEGPSRVDAVFSDVVMPGALDGWGLAAVLRERYPGLAVVLATGYSPNRAGELGAHGVELLAKPYRAEELVSALRRAFAAVGRDP